MSANTNTNDFDIAFFVKMIETAMQMVPPQYFSVSVAENLKGDTIQKRRERVYTYELYHNIRILQEIIRSDLDEAEKNKFYNIVAGNGGPLTSLISDATQEIKEQLLYSSLNAEIDKRGHSIIKEDFNPDMIFHVPGKMVNYSVIEIKCDLNKAGIKKDFHTIKCMLHCYQYQYGVFILTHHQWNEFKKVFNRIWNELAQSERTLYKQLSKKIFIILQSQPNTRPQKHALSEIEQIFGNNT